MPDPLRPSGERAEKGLGWRLKPGTLPSEAAALLVLSLWKDALCQAEGFDRPPKKIGFEVSEKSPTYRTASDVARTTDN